MKTTMIFTAEGETFVTVSYKPGEVTKKNIRPLVTLDFAETVGSEETGYSVKFGPQYFKKFDRTGFATKQSALNHVQDIVEGYFDAYIEKDPPELYETNIA